MTGYREALSGDVTQWINPMYFWVQPLEQIGFINVRFSSSSDPATEARIVREVASYGRQLGWLIEIVELLRERSKIEAKDQDEAKILDQFERLNDRIEEIKKQSRRQRIDALDVAGFVQSVRDLKDTDPSGYAWIVEWLQTALPRK